MGSKADIILIFLQRLAEARGANAKKSVLKEYLVDLPQSEYVKDFVHYVCNPEVNLYKELNDKLRQPIKGFNRPVEFDSMHGDVCGVFEEILSKPREMLRGQAGDRLFQSAYHHLEKRFHPLLDLFILRSLKAGVGAKTINAVTPNLIPEYGYQRCDKGTTEKVQAIIDQYGECLIQKKEDGMFLTAYGDSLRCVTRNGMELISQSLGSVKDFVSTLDIKQHGIIGECLIFDRMANEWLPRAKGNGMLNSIIQTGEDIDDRFEIVLIAWDMVPIEVLAEAKNRKDTTKNPGPQKPYLYRLSDLRSKIKEKVEQKNEELTNQHGQHTVYDSPVRVLATESVTSVDEFRDIYREHLQNGFEGVVAKTPEFFWYDGTAKEMLKFKAEIEDDFRLVELLKGDPNGKYANTIGSVRFQSEDGLIEFSCAGIKDDQRADMLKNPGKWVDKIFSVRFNEICESESKPDVYSVTFPRIISEPRLDKTHASTYPEVLETIENYFENI